MDIGPPELILILVVVLVLFGGAQLPKLAKNLGKAQREFKSVMQGADEPSTAEPPAADASVADKPAADIPVADTSAAGTPTGETATAQDDSKTQTS